MIRWPPRVTVVEVGPRDGFQVERTMIPTPLKVDVVNALARAGVRKIEATSFVSPKMVPQMADAAEVMAAIERHPGTRYTALVPNLKGAERAVAADVDGVRLVICCTETYNRKNVGMSVEQSIAVCRDLHARLEGGSATLEVVIALAFGCPFEGPVSDDRVAQLAHRIADLGVRELSIADSVGLGNPAQVQKTMSRLRLELAGISLSLHLHDTRGLGLANVLAALDAGVDTFDASFGGLGGCPVLADGAGNISTEDLTNLCEQMGIETGIDNAAVQEVSRMMEAALGRRLPSRVLAAGTPNQLYGKIDTEGGGT